MQEVVAKVRRTWARRRLQDRRCGAGAPEDAFGEILRNVMRAIADGVEYKLPGTIEDEGAVDIVKEVLEKAGYPSS